MTASGPECLLGQWLQAFQTPPCDSYATRNGYVNPMSSSWHCRTQQHLPRHQQCATAKRVFDTGQLPNRTDTACIDAPGAAVVAQTMPRRYIVRLWSRFPGLVGRGRPVQGQTWPADCRHHVIASKIVAFVIHRSTIAEQFIQKCLLQAR